MELKSQLMERKVVMVQKEIIREDIFNSEMKTALEAKKRRISIEKRSQISSQLCGHPTTSSSQPQLIQKQ